MAAGLFSPIPCTALFDAYFRVLFGKVFGFGGSLKARSCQQVKKITKKAPKSLDFKAFSWQGRTLWMLPNGAPARPPFGLVGKGEKTLTDGEAPLAGVRHLQGLFDVVPVVGLEPTRGISPTDFEFYKDFGGPCH